MIPNIADFQRENAEEMERIAEIKLNQAIELQCEAMELQQRAARLRLCLAYGVLTRAGEGEVS